MVDEKSMPFPAQNIRSLLQELSTGVDNRLRELRVGSRYANVRNSDVKVFMRAYRGPSTVAEIARVLDISRQAVHASVTRLQALKIVALQAQPGNDRDKLVVVTERGLHAQNTALEQIKIIEAQMADAIGVEALEQLRHQLSLISQSFKSTNKAVPHATGVKSSKS
jgi:DNA-binding MarR family transcriptional regulator